MPRARAIECTWRDRSSGMVVRRVAISVLPYCWRSSVVNPAVGTWPREELSVKVAATPAPGKVRRWPTTAVHATPASVSFAWAPVVAAHASADRRDTR